MINPYYFTDRAIQVGFSISLERHRSNHAISRKKLQPNFSEFGIEFRYINKILKELAAIHVRLINQYKYKNQTVSFSKIRKTK